MTTALAISHPIAEDIERVLIGGDLSKLTADQRLNYYRAVCESVGLNQLTKPFEFITLNGKLVLYARKEATDQLRKIHNVSITSIERVTVGDVHIVTASAMDRSGRTDVATGAVSIGGLKGEALANSLMKSESKAKRRVTLSICGLGMLDEMEIEDMEQTHAITKLDHPAIAEPRRKSEAPEVPSTSEPKPAAEKRSPGIYIERVDEKSGETNGKEWTVYYVHTSDGEKYGTFSVTDADLANAAKRGGHPVAIESTVNAKGNKQLTSLEVLS